MESGDLIIRVEREFPYAVIESTEDPLDEISDLYIRFTAIGDPEEMDKVLEFAASYLEARRKLRLLNS